MEKYIISINQDYGDEFDYPIVSVFSEEVRELVLEALEEIDISDYLEEVYFGTNEYMSFSTKEVKDMIIHASNITERELAVLSKYDTLSFGLDIIDHIVDAVLDEVENKSGYEDLFEALNKAYHG